MAPRHKITSELTASKQDVLINDIINGRSMVSVANEVGVSDSSVRRWFDNLPEDRKLMVAAREKQKMQIAAAEAAKDLIVTDGDEIDNDLRWLVRRLRQSIEAVGGDDDKLLELAQMREMRQQLMDLGKIRGMFANKIDLTINLADSPQFQMLRQIILAVLERHPEAKTDFLLEMDKMKVVVSV